MPLRPARPSIAIILLLLAFAAMSRLFWGCFAEDSFIVARYCANLLRGDGLVFNPGERVDMLTSPLHVLVLLPFEALSGNAIKAYSIACAIGMALLGGHAAKRLFEDGARRALFVAGVLLFPPFCFWTVGGLETPILAALTLMLLLAWRTPGRHDGVAILTLAAAAILTRYDALLLVGPAAIYTIATQRNHRRVLLAAFALAAIGAAWFAFCWRYYGDVLPTSFYTKNPGDWTASGALRGALYEVNLLVLFALPPGLALLLGQRNPGRRAASRDPRPDWPLFAGIALYFAYGCSAGIVHMMYLYRLFVPCLPWLFALAIARIHRRPRPAAIAAVVALQFALAIVVYTRALNFNLTLFFTHQQPLAEVFEFSTFGARANKQTDKGFAAQARDLRAHWQAQPQAASGAVPRLHSITEGQPPYELPGFYAFGPLASYRHDCHADTVASSHYLQHLDWLDEHGVELFPLTQPGWQLVARMDVPVTDWNGVHRAIRLDWYYQADPQPNPLPSTLRGQCAAASG